MSAEPVPTGAVLHTAGAALFAARLPALAAVYKAAFLDLHEADPVRATAERTAHMSRHGGRPDLVLAVALAPAAPAGTADPLTADVVGFCYSYRGAAGQWWHDIVTAAVGPQPALRWLSSVREIVELHVLPGWQGRGLGRALLRAALAGATEATTALSARDDPGTAARALYAAEGYRPLLTGFQFPGSVTRYLVLARDLPLTPAAVPSGR